MSTRRAEKVALVTGISRAAGIGYGIARRLVDDGFLVVGTGFRSYDDSMPWGSDAELPPLVRDGTIDYLEADFSTDTARTGVMDRMVGEYGSVTSLILNHACSHDEGILDLTSGTLGRSWKINVESSLLLLRDCARLGGLESVVLVTSGQSVAPMPDEIPYALTKGAIQSIVPSLSASLADMGTTVNCINPGPVDTGWASGDLYEAIRSRFPAGRWGHPTDVANLVAWLVGPDGRWVTGQTISSEGGFRR